MEQMSNTNTGFTHLHVHTEYSLLDGLSRIKPLVARAVQQGMDSLAITDHGSLYGLIEFYMACHDAKIKPILCCETYLAEESLTSKTPKDKSPYHLVVLARNNQGYRNLMQLITTAHIDGFYYKPRIDKKLLEKHHEGLIVLSGCLNGEIPKHIENARLDEAIESAKWYKEIFKDDFYLEIQRHPKTPVLNEVNKHLIDIGNKLSIPIVATNDNHYIIQEDAPNQDILVCIHTNTTINDPKRLKMDDDSYYLKSSAEMDSLFEDIPEALNNTRAIADKCDVTIDFSKFHLPEFDIPKKADPDNYLKELCIKGLQSRIPNHSEEYDKRLEYELSTIKETKYAHYFLVVSDIAKFARDKGILFGIRGSAAASLALYCLSVTDIDPLEYTLVFQRFLNTERKEMPDIDMDFQDNRRDEVIKYVVDKYTKSHVAQIITFGTMGPKAAIRDVGRALGIPYSEVDRIAKLILFNSRTIDEAMEQNPDLMQVYKTNPEYTKLIDTAKQLEGVIRHSSTHAAGIVISKDPLYEYIPLQRPIKDDNSETPMTQFSMEYVAKLGLLKMDLLGLSYLTILEKAIKIINRSKDINLNLEEIPLDDANTFDLLSKGETTNVFQLESTGMRRNIKALKPDSVNDVAAMIALYRPGPMEQIDTFVKAKHGEAKITYPHETLKTILEETYGVIVYQDQVLLIVQAFAGYSLGEADVVRKAMGKKVPEIMKKEKEKFIKGTLEKGFSKEEAQDVFALIEPFAGYAFNKAHSVSYAILSYWTAFLKANYTEEYMTAVLNSRLGSQEKLAGSIDECYRLGIPTLPPSINDSLLEFAIEETLSDKKHIRFGLGAIKNVGSIAINSILDERKTNGKFDDIQDFFSRTASHKLNHRALESLVKIGVFDVFADRTTILSKLDQLIGLAQKEEKNRISGQETMFEMFGEEVKSPSVPMKLTENHTEIQEILTWERELIGTEISKTRHLSLITDMANGDAIISRHDLDTATEGSEITLVGTISSLRYLSTKQGGKFLKVSLKLLGGEVELAVWPNVLNRSESIWTDGKCVTVAGKIKHRGEQITVSCKEVSEYQVVKETKSQNGNGSKHGLPQALDSNHVNSPLNETPSVSICIEETSNTDKDIQLLNNIMQLLLKFPGNDQFQLRVKSGNSVKLLDFPTIKIANSSDLQAAIRDMLGPNSITTNNQ